MEKEPFEELSNDGKIADLLNEYKGLSLNEPKLTSSIFPKLLDNWGNGALWPLLTPDLPVPTSNCLTVSKPLQIISQQEPNLIKS